MAHFGLSPPTLSLWIKSRGGQRSLTLKRRRLRMLPLSAPPFLAHDDGGGTGSHLFSPVREVLPLGKQGGMPLFRREGLARHLHCAARKVPGSPLYRPPIAVLLCHHCRRHKLGFPGFTLLGPRCTKGLTLLGPSFIMGFTLLGPSKVVQHSRKVNLPVIEYPVLATSPMDNGSAASA